MKKIRASSLYFITAFFSVTTSIAYFISNKILLGFTYACLTITFCLFGLSNKSKGK